MLNKIEDELRSCLKYFLPIIDLNYNKSKKDWEKGIISKGAYEYIYQRYVVAHYLISETQLVGEELYDVYAPLSIDIESGMLMLNEGLEDYQQKYTQWLLYFDSIGFTDRQPVFSYPIKNLKDFDSKKNNITEVQED